MSLITRQDKNGVKPLLQTGELGYDKYPAGGDSGRVYVGTGSVNIPLAKKSEVDSVVEGTTNIVYDNSTSGITATTVKAAIDEVNAKVDAIDNSEAAIALAIALG